MANLGPLTLGIARNADALLLLIDISREPCDQLRTIVHELEDTGLSIRQLESDVTISRTTGGTGIQVLILGQLLDGTADSARSILQGYGLNNVSVTIKGKARVQDVEDVVLESTMLYKPSIIVANKIDLRDSLGQLEELVKCSGKTPVIPISCLTNEGLSNVGPELFEKLRIIRVYTREPNEPQHSPDPFVLKEGSTVADLAWRIHTRLAKDLRYAKIWGPSAKYDGEKVGPTHVLLDGDIVQIRAA